MKKTATTILILLTIIAFVIVIFISSTSNIIKNNTIEKNGITNIEINKFYLLEIKNKKDPFDKPKRDTILILNKKDGYVKWVNKRLILDSSKYWNSTEEEFILNHIVNIKSGK